jgi:dihydrodipicolinate synthase/N-acetylneuraminate lyase
VTGLEGIWAALVTPFDVDDRIDEKAFRENIGRLHAAGVHGVYTSDADGEFYALELDEFQTLIDILADETSRLGLPCQAGVSWCNTSGVVARLRHAASRGIQGAHVGHPIYMRMTSESWLRYWHDVRNAVPESFGLVHYNTPKMPNYLVGPDYATLLDQIPNLVGTKYVGADVVEFGALVRHAPTLSHFVGEHSFGFLAPYGATGIYSWFANFNPEYVLAWHAEALAGNWTEVARRQTRMLEFIEASAMLTEGGHEHAAIAKALASASDFLVPTVATRKPYLPIAPERITQWKKIVNDRFADMQWAP